MQFPSSIPAHSDRQTNFHSEIKRTMANPRNPLQPWIWGRQEEIISTISIKYNHLQQVAIPLKLQP